MKPNPVTILGSAEEPKYRSKPTLERKLPNHQRFILDLIREKGGFVRYPTGSWSYIGCNEHHNRPCNKIVPDVYTTLKTIEALINRGLLVVVEEDAIGPKRVVPLETTL